MVRELFTGSLFVLFGILVLVETVPPLFFDGVVLLPISEVLIDVIVRALDADGRLTRGFLLEIDVLGLAGVRGRIVLGAVISEVLMDVIVLDAVTDGRLVAGFLLEMGACGLVMVLGFVIFFLVLLAGGGVLDGAFLISLVLTVVILLAEKLVRR